jgi:3-methylcrotonyl-CoA carboxylase beta subunit
MSVIESSVDRGSAEFAANAQVNRGLAEKLRALIARVEQGGSAAARAQHEGRGKMFVRDRVDRLLDAGSPFLEIGQLAGHELYDDWLPAGGVVAGIGRVGGIECVIVANDATVKGGTYYPITVKKHLRAQEIALDNRLPCIYLVDSGGAFRCSSCRTSPASWSARSTRPAASRATAPRW